MNKYDEFAIAALPAVIKSYVELQKHEWFQEEREDFSEDLSDFTMKYKDEIANMAYRIAIAMVEESKLVQNEDVCLINED